MAASTVARLGWWPQTQEPTPTHEDPSARDTARAQGAGAGARHASLGPASDSAQGLTVAASLQSDPRETAAQEVESPRPEPAGGEVSLAPPQGERSPADGLPAAGMRCSFAGG